MLIHGLGQQASKDWLPLLPALAEHYQLLLFDLPGFGDSARPDADLTPKKYADLVHWLVSQHAREPVFVVGHSLGGAIALRYSHDYPEEVARLLLIDVAGVLQSTVFARHLSLVPDQVASAPVLDKWVAKGSRILNRMSGKIQDLLAGSATALQAMASSDKARELLYQDSSDINAALGLVNEDFSPMIRQIHAPVWLLWGEQDPVAPLRTGLALQWLLPQAQLDTLSGVGHVPMSEDTAKTSEWLLRSLRGPLPDLKEAKAGESQGDGVCKDGNNMVFRGPWRSLRLEHCTNVRIEDATLGRLTVVGSTVDILNVEVRSPDVAVEARDAHIMATGLRITAPQAWAVEDSRLDLAAFEAQAAQFGQQKGRALFFMSLGRWCDGSDEWRLHEVWKPRQGKLDEQFRQARDGRCALEAGERKRS
ncbi:MAG TPA: alpha/beta hydrolase [Ideonella sp.]|uniref:alpha/beta hydrolase n=1 Tax=Ideonella sp. TaxID=1929293 RepID=UPI002E37FCCF|nr:alpha/beta hydrolase [Ideonella sp.]HEX5686632.1 alpha/beta hydrolase [Ideonella sp.]